MQFLSTRQFWQLKLSQPPVHDMVMAGNSRMVLGLSPSHMAEAMAGWDIFNFAFAACVLEEPYLEHAASLLSTRGGSRALVLGISPHSLVPLGPTGARLGYAYWSRQDRPRLTSLLRGISRDNHNGKALGRVAARNLHNLVKGLPLSNYFHDGWEASLPLKQEPGLYAQRLGKVYERRRVSPFLYDGLLTKVEAFRGRGIEVYGFRPPCDPAVRLVEDTASGLDFDVLLLGFRQAGGVWLEVEDAGVTTYDGVHMDYRGARRFSRRLARQLAGIRAAKV